MIKVTAKQAKILEDETNIEGAIRLLRRLIDDVHPQYSEFGNLDFYETEDIEDDCIAFNFLCDDVNVDYGIGADEWKAVMGRLVYNPASKQLSLGCITGTPIEEYEGEEEN